MDDLDEHDEDDMPEFGDAFALAASPAEAFEVEHDEDDMPQFGDAFALVALPAEAAGAPAAPAAAAAAEAMVVGAPVLEPPAARLGVRAAKANLDMIALRAPGEASLYGRPDQRSRQQRMGLSKLMVHCRQEKRMCDQVVAQATLQAQTGPQANAHARCLALSYSANFNTTSLAREHCVSRAGARRMMQATAWAHMQAQDDWCDQMEQQIRRDNMFFETFWERESWDEARQTFVVYLTDLISRDAQRGAWDKVGHRWTMGWQREHEKGVQVTFIIPPVVILGKKTSGAIHDALWNQRCTQRLQRFAKFMSSRASTTLRARTGDADGRNIRLAVWSAAAHPADAESFYACILHQGNISVGAASEGQPELLASLNSYTLLLKMGSYWLRTVLSVSSVVDEPGRVRIRRTPPAPQDLKLWELILDFFFEAPRPLRKQASVSQGRQVWYMQTRAEFLALFNGYPGSDYITHHCAPSRCNCRGEADTKARMKRSLLTTGFRSRFPVPAVKEFTKVKKATVAFALPLATHGLIRPIFKQSISKILPKHAISTASPLNISLSSVPAHDRVPLADEPVAEQPQQTTKDAQFLDDVSWHKLAGARIKKVERDLMPMHQGPAFITYTLIVSAIDEVSVHSLASLKADRVPPLLDYTHPEYDPATRLAQFFLRCLQQSIRRYSSFARPQAIAPTISFSWQRQMQPQPHASHLPGRQLGTMFEICTNTSNGHGSLRRSVTLDNMFRGGRRCQNVSARRVTDAWVYFARCFARRRAEM